jgi:hypothetical protein
MTETRARRIRVFASMLLLAGCAATPPAPAPTPAPSAHATDDDAVAQGLARYATVRLTSDLGRLTPNQRQMVGLLIEASQVMDELFWLQAYGEPAPFLDSLDDPDLRRLAKINYGPWDRLDGDRAFVEGVGPKPKGARFYPPDMTVEEFEAAELEDKTGLYSLVRRDALGRLVTVPYHQAYQKRLAVAARLLARAADLAEDPEFKRYLTLRARALITDDYLPSDMAWMEMKNNEVDLVIGAIEQYEDQLFGYRAAYEAFVLLKDRQWSAQLARFAAFLPELQRSLPVDPLYKADEPGTDSDLNAYDVIYYAGRSNAGSKTIAINLPNDERVQLAKGTRRLQLKNAMRAKFDRILVPISERLIVADQREHVTFDAFFGTTMFHEVAHGLGPKHTVNGRGTVRRALMEQQSTMEEGKADILGLWMITWLHERGELGDADLMDYYVTFVASTFRSIRFGASSAHARSDMVRFNFLHAYGAITREDDGTWRVHPERLRAAMAALATQLLVLQGNGDVEGARRLEADMGGIGGELQADLDALAEAGIPVDVVFEQGPAVLGLR